MFKYHASPLDTGRKLNVYKTYRRRTIFMPNEKRKKAYDFSDIPRGYKDETSSRRFMYFNLKFLRNRIYLT